MSDPKPNLIVHPCVLAYPHLFIPRIPPNSDPGASPRRDCELYFYTSMPRYMENYTVLTEAVARVTRDKWGSKAPNFKNPPVQDLKHSKGCPAGQAGFFIRAKSYGPVVVSRRSTTNSTKMEVVTDPEDVYPGIVVAAALGYSTYDKAGNKGVTFWINTVLLLKDGPRLGRADASPEVAFADHMGQMEFGQLTASVPAPPTMDAGLPPMPGLIPPGHAGPVMPAQDLSAFGIPF